MKETNLERFCQNQLRNPFDKFLVLHLKGILFIHKNKFDEAYSFQKDLLKYPFFF